VTASPQAPGRARAADGSGPDAGTYRRPLVITGAIAAAAVAATGVALLTTLVAIGWITAPHAGLGNGLPGVLRTAITIWLAAHHVGFTLHGAGLNGAGLTGAGHIGLLPLGLLFIPGALLWRAGRWVVRTGDVGRLRHVGYAALALAVPYALLSGALALAARSSLAAPSLVEAVAEPFLVALVAGGLGGARALAPWRRLVGLLPVRTRSVTMGTLATLALLVMAGAVLDGASLIAHLSQVRELTDQLDPGPIGALLLVLVEIAYVPNAVVWAIAFCLGPGFAFGVGTVVAPTGAALGELPSFPLLAALPSGQIPGWLSLVVLAIPYLAAAAGGILTVRVTPTPVLEAAPAWGFVSGAAAGAVLALLSALSGGALGDGRLATVGPSAWQVGLVAILEMGVTSAVTAGAANWWILRRDPEAGFRFSTFLAARPVTTPEPPAREPAGVIDETDTANGHRIFYDPWAHDRDPGPE
jgi:hypothetical protein